MKCDNAEQLLLLQDSGELTCRKTAMLRAHLNTCQACRTFQKTLLEYQGECPALEEPSFTAVQNVLRAARVNAPTQPTRKIFALKPSLALAAAMLIGLGLFFTTFNSETIGMELVVNETQLLETEDQVISVMYSGLSEDDLAFNFLMTYEESIASL